MSEDLSGNFGLDLPLGEALLYCDCGFESEAFCFSSHTYGCLKCCAVVFTIPLPFIFAAPKCNQCDRQLASEDRIPASRMSADAAARCPRCRSETSKLRSLQIHLLDTYLGDSIPVATQLIHARTHQPERSGEPFMFLSPRLTLELAMNVSFANRDRASIPNGYHEFRTIHVTDHSLVVEYVRQLPASDWGWYLE